MNKKYNIWRKSFLTIALSLSFFLFANLESYAGNGIVTIDFASPAYTVGMSYNSSSIIEGISFTVEEACTVKSNVTGMADFTIYLDGTQVGTCNSFTGTSAVIFTLPQGEYIWEKLETGMLEYDISITSLDKPSSPSTDEVPTDRYTEEIKALESSVELISSPTTILFEEGTALPLSIMQALSKNPNVSLEFKYQYEGTTYDIIIPAGKAEFDESIPWYGPLWLIQTFGEYDPNSKGAYTVQSGDTLGDIAHANGMTIEELLKKNPQISDINLIYPGEVINL